MPSPVRFSPIIDAEAVALEFVGDVAGVVDRLLQRRLGVGIFRVADHQRKPVAAAAAADGTIGATKKSRSASNARRILMLTAVQPNKAPIPACAAATLLYANRIIKPAPAALSTACKLVVDRDN